IMTYLLSLPDDWVVNLDEIKRNATDGESSFRSGWKELVSAGYVSKQQGKDEKTKKINRRETMIKEMPKEKKTHNVEANNVENHNVESQQGENHQVENHKLQSTEVLSTDIQSTNKSTSRSKLKFETHHVKLAELLYKEILHNIPQHKKPNLESWANDFRLMMEIDKREGKEIQELILFSQSHDFWYKNILSAGKLREKYDVLILEKYGKQGNKKNRKVAKF